MKCLSVEQIYLYLERELPSPENKKIENHIAGCLKCRKALEDRKLFLQAIESLPSWQVPSGFTQQVLDKIFPSKVSLLAWLGTASAGLASIILAISIFFLTTGQNFSGLLISLNHSLWNYLRNLSLIFVKLFTLASLSVKLLHQFFGYLIKGITWFTSLVNPQIQIIIITVTIILIVSFIYGMKRKILIGEKA